MTGNENHVDKCLPGGGGGVGSLGGGSGDGVSLNLNSFKRYFACLKKAKHRNYVHCRWRGCIMYQRISTHLFLAASPVWAGRPGEADNGGYDFQR